LAFFFDQKIQFIQKGSHDDEKPQAIKSHMAIKKS